MKKAIVLSGGGTKGAYQMGFWKAIRKLNIKYDIVTGTSAGALNGAFMAQNTYYKTLFNWKKGLNFYRLFGKDIKNDFMTFKGKREFIRIFGKDIIQGGMDAYGLEDLLKKYLNPIKLKKSKIDYGLVTYNLTAMRPLEITKDEMKAEEIIDYIMASATCFPAFKIRDISGSKFIDGGYYDNLPINLAIRMGATEVIAVDLKAIGIKQNIKTDIPITYIKPNRKLAPVLAFDKKLQNRLIKIGYNDTMKVLDGYGGYLFTFKKQQLEKNYNKYINDFMINFNYIFNNDKKSIISELLKNTIYNKLLNHKGQLPKTFNDIIEYTGKVFRVDETKIYRIKDFNKIILNNLKKVTTLNALEIEKKIYNKDFKALFNTDFIIKHIYNKLIKMDIDHVKKEIRQLAMFFPKEVLAALYLYTIKAK